MQETKIFWCDTETTGLNAWKNDIIQLAGLVEVNDIVLEEFNLNCQPHSYENVEDTALAVHGISLDDIKQFDNPLKTWNKFCRMLDKHVNKYDKNDKFILAGYNASFDKDMLYAWWSKCEQQFFGSYFEYKVFDVFPLVYMFATYYGWDVPNHKLETICDYLGIPIQAHDALWDIKASREVYRRLRDALPSNFVPRIGE